MSAVNKIRLLAVRALIGGAKVKDFSMSDPGDLFGQSTGGILPAREPSQERLLKLAQNWVYKCINKNADAHAAATLRLYKVKGKDRKDWTEIEDHPLLDLLNSPSKTMVRFELFRLWSMQDDLCGNVYWLLEGVKNEDDEPDAIKVLNPGRVRIVVEGDELKSYEYRPEGSASVIKYLPHQILHFRNPAPAGGFLGKGPAGASIDAIDGDNWARDWMRRFFEQGSSPGMLFESNTNEDSIIKMLRESFEERFSGRGKSHRIGVLPSGVKVAYEGKGGQDMEFSTQRTQSRDEILAAFGVPGPLLGLGLGETVNRASMGTLEYIYSKWTVRPRLVRFVTFLNELYVPRWGDDLVLDFDDPTPEDEEATITAAESALGRQPYKSINEIRREAGLVAIEGGDAIMGSSLLMPVGTVPESKSAGGPPVKKGEIVPYKSRFAKNAEKRKDAGDKLSIKILEVVKQFKKDAAAALPEDWTPIWEATVKRVVPHEKDMQKAMATYAADMTDRVIADLTKVSKKSVTIKSAIDDFVKNPLVPEDEVALIIKLMGPLYQEILVEEGVKAADLIGAAFDATDKRTQDALEKAVNLMAKTYTDETIALLQEKLQEGLDAGDALPDLKKKVQEIGEFSESVRAKRVANTEAFRTANFAAKEAWTQSGVVKTIKWYTAADEKVCEFCGPMDGTVVGIEENFFNVGDEVEGKDGNKLPINYAPVEAGTLHPNCRCVTRPDEIVVSE